MDFSPEIQIPISNCLFDNSAFMFNYIKFNIPSPKEPKTSFHLTWINTGELHYHHPWMGDNTHILGWAAKVMSLYTHTHPFSPKHPHM